MNAAGALAPWRFAARLARREVQRRPGRTVLVALLVALPVAGMTIFSVLARSDQDWFTRENGRDVDLVVSRTLGEDVDVESFLPNGATVDEYLAAWIAIEDRAGETEYISLRDRGDFRPGSVLSISAGRPPEDGEVWLSSSLAEELGVDVGDTLALRHPSGSWAVSGVGESSVGLDERVMVMPGPPVDQFRSGTMARVSGIKLPDDLPREQVEMLGWSIRNAFGDSFSPTSDGSAWWREDRPNDGIAPLAWGWVAGTVALAATGIIVAAAFATSARRQLATIGILSSNGSSERLTRRMLALQGAWTGLVGSLTGIVLGVTVLLAGRSLFAQAQGYELTRYRFGAGYLAVIAVTGTAAATLAALVPARTASKVPVTAAIAGRRPLGKVPPRLVPRGITFAALGSLLLVISTASRDGGALPTLAAILGGVLVLVGMCCCSPLAVDWMSRTCGRLSGAWRLAGRGLGRTRTRSAAVVTAIAVIGALTTAGAAVAANLDGEHSRQLPEDALLITPSDGGWTAKAGTVDIEPPTGRQVDDEIVAAVEAVVPSATWHPRRIATWDPAPFPDTGDSYLSGATVQFVVADEAVMDLYDLSEPDRAALRDVGAIALVPSDADQDGWANPTSPVRLPATGGEVVVEVASSERLTAAVRDGDFDRLWGFDPHLITAAAAAGYGFPIVAAGAIVRTASPLSHTQRMQLQEAVHGAGVVDLGQYYVDVPRSFVGEQSSSWNVMYEWPDGGVSGRTVQGILVGVAFALTLLVVAIGLALAAAEGAIERDVLVAVGGRPRTMRSMAGVKAVSLTLTGLALAIPFGLLPILAVMRATGNQFHMPWLVLGAFAVVPVVAGAAAWLVSATAQLIRPFRISTLAFD